MRIEEIEDSRRLELLINGVLDYAIYTIDLEGNIVSWNSGAERLKGYRKRDHWPPFPDLLHDEDQDQGLPQRALSIAATEGQRRLAHPQGRHSLLGACGARCNSQ